MRKWAKGTRSGFTLIELSFAIAFISVLLITITLITREIVSIYRKGYAIKTVNQVGRDIIVILATHLPSPLSAMTRLMSLATAKTTVKATAAFIRFINKSMPKLMLRIAKMIAVRAPVSIIYQLEACSALENILTSGTLDISSTKMVLFIISKMALLKKAFGLNSITV